MVINGKEYGFKLTVGASIQIAKLCPNGDLSRIAEAVGGEYGQQAETMARFVEALSNGYAAAEEFEGRNANRLSYESVLTLSPSVFSDVCAEAFKAFGADVKGEIEVEPSKKAVEEG